MRPGPHGRLTGDAVTGRLGRVAAWAVHAYTASGAGLALERSRAAFTGPAGLQAQHSRLGGAAHLAHLLAEAAVQEKLAVRRLAAHESSPAGKALYQVFIHQAGQRLADRLAAHPISLADLHLWGQQVAGSDQAALDHLAQVQVNLVIKRDRAVRIDAGINQGRSRIAHWASSIRIG